MPDPRQTAAYLLEVIRDGRWRTRAELRGIAGSSWPLLLRALEQNGHAIVFERSKHDPGSWFRARLAYEASAPAEPLVEEPEQLALAVAGTAAPRSALLGLEEAA